MPWKTPAAPLLEERARAAVGRSGGPGRLRGGEDTHGENSNVRGLRPAYVVDLRRILDAEMPAGQKAVLMTLAVQSLGTGVSWIGLAALSRKTGFSRRHLVRLLADLAAGGHVEHWQRAGSRSYFVISEKYRGAAPKRDVPAGYVRKHDPSAMRRGANLQTGDKMAPVDPAIGPDQPVTWGHRTGDTVSPRQCQHVTPVGTNNGDKKEERTAPPDAAQAATSAEIVCFQRATDEAESDARAGPFARSDESRRRAAALVRDFKRGRLTPDRGSEGG